jgi:exodeoxyribonuclease V beta subunit
MKNFDLLKCPLRGSGLIEASAGTGKTHAIAGLYIRLILEAKLKVSEILVVTFTVAATQELRERIRTRLRETLMSLTGKREVGSDDEVKNADAIKLLQDAMKRFDEAAIYTIHSFCQQVLFDNAFESGSFFDTKLITDQRELLQEIVDDFWRIHFYGASEIIMHSVLSEFSTDYFLRLLKRRSIDPSFEIVPCLEKPDDAVIQGTLESLRIAYEHLSREWPGVRSEIENIILNDSGLNRRNYQKRWIPVWLKKMDSFVNAGIPLAEFPQLAKFTTRHIRESTKEGSRPPEHPFFDIGETLQLRRDESADIINRYMLSLKGEFFDFVRDELERRKAERNVRSFDDLLVNMHQALSGRGKSDLIGATRRRFKAALIDEFQDTDPIQYNIFTTIFGADESLLYLIGDPKQAIFGFRGADIFSYMKASRRVRYRYTMATNWRSDPDLVAAINTIFSRARNPFVFEDIGFIPVLPARENRGELLIKDQLQPPFHFWFIDGRYADNRDGVSINRTTAEKLISRAVAAEISQLTSRNSDRRATIGDKTLMPGDIAVLVRARRQARMVQEELARLSIPSVLHGAESIFASHEALELERVMVAIAEPGNETYVRTALTTDIFGLSGNDLFHLNDVDSPFENILNDFYRYHNLWAQYGFMRMFRSLINQEGVRLRLLSLSDGERRVTNLLHITELLHGTEVEKKFGMEGLIKWLSERRENPDSEEELRLETDDDAVKLVTIHSSKGLEYPVVFCPFTWSGAGRDTGEFTFHDPNREYNLTLDIGSRDEANRIIAQREDLAENIRLLYVAITRARHRCYLVWGKINQTEKSAPAYLLHQPGNHDPDLIGGVSNRVKTLGSDEMLGEIEELVKASQNTIALSLLKDVAGEKYVPHDVTPGEYDYRRFTGRIHRDWVMSSYTSLISDRKSESELPDYDRVDRDIDRGDRDVRDDIFGFPRGPKAGQCIHEIFEDLDFKLKDQEILKVLIEKLNKYGFELKWQDALLGMVKNVLATALSGDRDFTLRSVESIERLNELEFYFPLERATSSGLADIFSQFGMADVTRGFSGRIRELNFRPVRGYMRGFIDMVFRSDDRYHIVDWKSNYLGEGVDNYSPEAVQSAMEEHYYILQYHLYAVALHRYLAMRVPGYDYRRHFGGVYYIFVRGVDRREPRFGIYRDTPSTELIEALSEYLGFYRMAS